MNKIVPLSAFNDNYIWALHQSGTNHIVVVDPGDANPVLAYLEKNNLELEAVLITHHHYDHSGGILNLCQEYPNIPVYGPANESIKGITHPVIEGMTIDLKGIGAQFKVMDIPGHTLGHVAYYNEQVLFCGDTLFSSGCGRLFEGTPEQMVGSLDKIRSLPGSIQMYCGHEYTQNNLAFVLQVTPHNPAVKQRMVEVNQLVAQKLPTLPVKMAIEFLTNPFLRIDENEVISAALKHANMEKADRIKVFTILREWKNNFAR